MIKLFEDVDIQRLYESAKDLVNNTGYTYSRLQDNSLVKRANVPASKIQNLKESMQTFDEQYNATLTDYRKTLVRYGTIIDDFSLEKNGHHIRKTVYQLSGKLYTVMMVNGDVIEIKD